MSRGKGTGEGAGKWPRCPECDALTYRDTGRCPNPICPLKQDADENEGKDTEEADG